MHGLGRRPSPPDARDYDLALLLNREPIPEKRLWYSDTLILNQGNTPHCLGFGWAGWGRCEPVHTKYRNPDAHKIYYEAKVFDGEPNQENGSTLRSGCKAMLKRGRISSYYFARTFRDALEFVGNHGPLVIGTMWYEGMYNPEGAVLQPTGNRLGGHCVLWRGIENGHAILRNSWGRNWGHNGEAMIKYEHLEKLLDEEGEACAAVEAPYPTDKPTTTIGSVIEWFRS